MHVEDTAIMCGMSWTSRIALAAATLLVAACSPLPALPPASGQTVPSGATAGAIDACAMLNRGEVAAALGEPVDEPISEQELVDYGCTYTPGAAASANMVSLELSPGSTFAQRKRFFIAQGGMPIDGLGEAAYAKGGAILVLQQTTIVYLVLLHDGWSDRRRFAAAQVLMGQALPRVRQVRNL